MPASCWPGLSGGIMSYRTCDSDPFPWLCLRTPGLLFKNSNFNSFPQIDKMGVPRGRAQGKAFCKSFPGDCDGQLGLTTTGPRGRRDQVGKVADLAEMLIPGERELAVLRAGPRQALQTCCSRQWRHHA